MINTNIKPKALALADELMQAHDGHSDEGPTTFSEAAIELRYLHQLNEDNQRRLALMNDMQRELVPVAVASMTDIELLELAAKVAGIVNYTCHDGGFQQKCLFVETGSRRGDSGYYWSPLTDDGDALRLAVKCGMLFTYMHERFELFQRMYREELDNDLAPSTATRRAIVRVAAEIGKANK